MIVVHRAFGMRFVIYVDDHEPAHVHVRGDGEVKVDLFGEGGAPEIVRVVGMTRADQAYIAGGAQTAGHAASPLE